MNVDISETIKERIGISDLDSVALYAVQICNLDSVALYAAQVLYAPT